MVKVGHQYIMLYVSSVVTGAVAEWFKAQDLGSCLSWRGFESRRRHIFFDLLPHRAAVLYKYRYRMIHTPTLLILHESIGIILVMSSRLLLVVITPQARST